MGYVATIWGRLRAKMDYLQHIDFVCVCVLIGEGERVFTVGIKLYKIVSNKANFPTFSGDRSKVRDD